jgi:hypothetical protein
VTLVFAALHSILASKAVKRAVGRVIGQRRRAGTYRLVYNAQAAVTTGFLVVYLNRLPDRTVYRITGPVAWAMRSAQLVSLLALLKCVQAVGLANFLGLAQLFRFQTYADPGPPTIEGQGPALSATGEIRITGPFQYHRHPTNFWPLVILWMQPHRKLSGLTFTIISTVYMLLGSYHQDLRLADTYGELYRRYRDRVPLFVPRPGFGTENFSTGLISEGNAVTRDA